MDGHHNSQKRAYREEKAGESPFKTAKPTARPIPEEQKAPG